MNSAEDSWFCSPAIYATVPKLVEVDLVVSRKDLNFVNVFSLFYNYLPLKMGGTLHLNKLFSPSPKDALWQVWLKLVQWFLRRFLNFVDVFSLFRNYLPLEKGGTFHLNKLESPWPKDAFCQVLLKLAQWFWRKGFLNFFNVFSLFRKYLPLEKDGTRHFNKLEFPSPKVALCKG